MAYSNEPMYELADSRFSIFHKDSSDILEYVSLLESSIFDTLCKLYDAKLLLTVTIDNDLHFAIETKKDITYDKWAELLLANADC